MPDLILVDTDSDDELQRWSAPSIEDRVVVIEEAQALANELAEAGTTSRLEEAETGELLFITHGQRGP